jgi:hypothetical protein
MRKIPTWRDDPKGRGAQATAAMRLIDPATSDRNCPLAVAWIK